MPKAAAIYYLNVCHSGKGRSRSAKKQILRCSLTYDILLNEYILYPCEYSIRM